MPKSSWITATGERLFGRRRGEQKARLRSRLLLVGAAAVALVGLTILVTIHVTDPVDSAGLKLAFEQRSAGRIKAAMLVTRLGELPAQATLTALVALLLWRSKRPRDASFLIAATVASAMANTGVKWFFARPRPVDPIPVYDAQYFSFPSGHSMAATSFFLALYLVLRDISPKHRFAVGAACMSLAASVCGTRVLLGVHYPSDVVAGALLASILVLTLDAVRTRVEIEEAVLP